MILKGDGNKVICERSETRSSTVDASEGELTLKSAKKAPIPDRDVLGGCSQIGGCSEDFPVMAEQPSERHYQNVMLFHPNTNFLD